MYPAPVTAPLKMRFPRFFPTVFVPLSTNGTSMVPVLAGVANDATDPSTVTLQRKKRSVVVSGTVKPAPNTEASVTSAYLHPEKSQAHPSGRDESAMPPTNFTVEPEGTAMSLHTG